MIKFGPRNAMVTEGHHINVCFLTVHKQVKPMVLKLQLPCNWCHMLASTLIHTVHSRWRIDKHTTNFKSTLVYSW